MKFLKTFVSAVLIGVMILPVALTAQEKKNPTFTIPEIAYQKFVLDNGLTLIVHEDHKAPIVAVNVWYHVGSKNEKPGKSGFAHLFEHLMFNGSENFDDDYFQALERVGATDLNGTTNEDRTNYFQNVPSSAVDIALWMESDRMGHLLGAVTQEKLDEQRGVVQNEKRQYENQPYGLAYELMVRNTAPAGHPYSWSVIGSMDDLNAAALEDVHEWFKTYYGAANAVIVVAGDITPDVALQKVKKYFGDIPAGPPVARHNSWVAKMSGTIRQHAQDRVAQSRIYKMWNFPEWGTKDADYLNLVSDVLGLGKNSRLYQRLVYEDQIATSVSAFIDSREINSQFYIQADAKPGVDLADVEKAIDEELAKFLKSGPTEKEMQRIKSQFFANFVRGIERIGGFGGKSDILASNEVYGGDPGYYKKTLSNVQAATAKDLQQSAIDWLSDGVYILEVTPFPEFATELTDVDRTKLPEPGEAPVVKFPDMQRATLSNGIKLVVAERHAVPLVRLSLMFDAGYASDQFGLPGTANLAMAMLDEGTKTRSSLEISEELALLGANLGTGSNLDMSFVNINALKSNLDASLNVYADVILNPSFPQKELDRLKKQQLAGIQQEKSTPVQMALRVFPKFLYGPGHAYGNPFTGSGTEEAVTKMTRDELVKFHDTWFKPNNATLVVIGDITMDEIKPKIEKLFKNWKQGEVPVKNISTVQDQEKPVVFLMDKPGAIQSIIFAGHLAPPKANPDEIAIETMNTILGGSFTSRINMNLREDKHWAYGALSLIFGARGQRPFIVYAPVQTDKTKESLLEIQKELKGILGDKPPTQDELVKVQMNETLKAPGSWETINEVGGAINDIVRYGLPDDYHTTYSSKVSALTTNDVAAAAKKLIKENRLVWLVVGDRATVEAGIKELGLGEVKIVDTDGNLVDKVVSKQIEK